ncbi:MAG: cytochrome C [Rubrivivax sp.]|nr:cytochrome C [Rubrivivax sp.]
MHKLTIIAATAAFGLGLGLTAPARADPQAAMTKAGCMACHAKDKKLVGPSFKDIAVKYKSQPGAIALLAEKSRKGGKGNWGPVPMPPNPESKISDAELKVAIEWVLKQ